MSTPDGPAAPGGAAAGRGRFRWLRVAAGIVFYLLAFALLIEAIERHWLEGWRERLDIVDVVSAMSLAVLARALMAMCWVRLLDSGAGTGPRVPGAAWAIYAVTALGKYVPGKLFTVAARTYLGRSARVPLPHAFEASLREPLLNIGMVTALGGALYVPMGAAAGTILMALGIAAALAAVRLETRVLWRYLLATFRPGTDPPPVLAPPKWVAPALLAMAAALAQACCVLVIALAQFPAVGTTTALAIVSSFLVSHVAGVLAVLAPAGIGVREGVQVAMLAGQFEPALLAGFLVSSRIIDVSADAMFAIGGAARLLAASRLTGRRKPTPGHA
jgi:hypothetical protein